MNNSKIASLLVALPKTGQRQVLLLVHRQDCIKQLVNYLYHQGFTTDFRNAKVCHGDGWAYVRARDNKHSWKYNQYSDLILPADLDEDGKRMTLARWRLGSNTERHLLIY